jgi:hypothetical protein
VLLVAQARSPPLVILTSVHFFLTSEQVRPALSLECHWVL